MSTNTSHPRGPDSRALRDFEPRVQSFCAEVLRGLTRAHKTLPCKFLYDERGARLFEQICELEEYYPTRTELGILERHLDELCERLGPRCLLVEFGSGSGIKTRMLLGGLVDPAGYVPIDISKPQLVAFADEVAKVHPRINVLPVCADYTGELELPVLNFPAARTVAFFPGSTIGNFDPEQAESFLGRVAALCGPQGGLLIGVDLKKDPGVLECAYNDSQGVTAAFNLNLLCRINRECGANFDLDGFWHHAPYNHELGRIEMRLVSERRQVVRVMNTDIAFGEGEHITTEHSYKYSLEEFRHLAERAGFSIASVWTDEAKLFSVQYLTTASRAVSRRVVALRGR